MESFTIFALTTGLLVGRALVGLVFIVAARRPDMLSEHPCPYLDHRHRASARRAVVRAVGGWRLDGDLFVDGVNVIDRRQMSYR